MPDAWMIYGANGYTGRLIAREAQRRGLTPILAGRNGLRLRQLGADLGFETRIFTLEDPALVARHLRGVAAVLHCAGPFSATSAPLLSGCLHAHAHYLDITGEIGVFERIFARVREFEHAGIVVLPGVGFDIVPSDGLAALLKHALPDATHLILAFTGDSAKLSRGTLKTMVETLPQGTLMRQNGQIVRVDPPYEVAHLPLAGPPEPVIPIAWGDVSTAYHATGIPNVAVYIAATPAVRRQMQVPRRVQQVLGLAPVQVLLKGLIGRIVWGPTDAELGAGEMRLWGEVHNAADAAVALRMRTPPGYAFTADAAVSCTMAVLERGVPPGAYTAAMAFGADFVLGLQGVTVTPVDH